MNKLYYYNKKKLKMSNVMMLKVLLKDNIDLAKNIEKMQNYIKVKGGKQVGPLIQYTKPYINDNKIEVEIVIMLQCKNFIQTIEFPYIMESIIQIPNCLYCRYTGPEEKQKFAYDKLNLEAFENDIQLSGDSYTIYVNRNEEEKTIIADVFMPRVDD